MNTFWLKIAGLALIVIVLIVIIGSFTSSDSEPAEAPAPEPKVRQKTEKTEHRTFHDQAEDDKKKFLTEPQAVEEQNEKLISEERKRRREEIEAAVKTRKEEPASDKSVILYFKPLDEVEKAEAERLLNVAVPGRSIGRLPTTGYYLMVSTCRQIITKWPDSWYAYRAKQMLADMPERYKPRYKITEQELDFSKFAKQRPGTEPYTLEDSP